MRHREALEPRARRALSSATGMAARVREDHDRVQRTQVVTANGDSSELLLDKKRDIHRLRRSEAETPSNTCMQRPALRSAADAERQASPESPCTPSDSARAIIRFTSDEVFTGTTSTLGFLDLNTRKTSSAKA